MRRAGITFSWRLCVAGFGSQRVKVNCLSVSCKRVTMGHGRNTIGRGFAGWERMYADFLIREFVAKKSRRCTDYVGFAFRINLHLSTTNFFNPTSTYDLVLILPSSVSLPVLRLRAEKLVLPNFQLNCNRRPRLSHLRK